MFNRYSRFPQLPFWAKVGEIPTSYKVAMSYEEQLLWLCNEIEKIKGSSGNIDYNALDNKPRINGIELKGNLSLDYLGIQGKLRAGNGIIIDGNIISATGGGGSGTDNYNNLNNKPQINGVTLQGNKTFSDLGLQTTKKYTEIDNYILGYYFDLFGSDTFIGDNIPRPLTNSNSCYLAINKNDYKTNRFRITGISEYEIWFTSSLNPLLENSTLTSASGYSGSSSRRWQYNNEEIEVNVPEEANYIIFNFTNTDELAPKVEAITETIEGGTTDYEELDNKPQINGVTLIGNKTFEDLGLVTAKSYEELTNYVTDHYYPSFFDEEVFIGDEIPQPEEFINSSFIVIDKQDIPSTSFRVTGNSVSQIWFTCSDNPTLSTSILRSVGTSGTPQDPVHYRDTEITIDVPENANFIVVNFTDTNEVTPKVEVISESISANDVKDLEANLILTANTQLTLDSGFYKTTENYKVYYHNAIADNLILNSYELFYFDNDSQTLIMENRNYFYETNDWVVQEHNNITNEILNDRSKIPTSKAVYDAIQNISPSSRIFTTLNESINLNDGTAPTLSEGWYYTGNFLVRVNNNLIVADKNFFYVYPYETNETLNYNIYCLDKLQTSYQKIINYSGTNQVYDIINRQFSNLITSSDVVSSIPATESDDDIPNVEAIRNYINNKISRYASFQITADTNLVTTADWSAKTVPLELITNHISDLISYDSSTNTFTASKNCKLKVELNSGLNYTAGVAGSPYFAILRIKQTSGGVSSYVSSSILLFGDTANSGSLINELQLNAGDTFSYEISFGTAGTYRILGRRTYVIFTEMN